jgi:hypothetical protein
MRLAAIFVSFCQMDMKKSMEPAKIPIVFLGYVNIPILAFTGILPNSFYTE